MQIKPVGDRILVKVLEEAPKTQSGIILPETAEKQKKSEGVVVEVGTGEKIAKLNLKAGDHVMFGKYSGEEMEIDKVEHKFLKDDEILAVIK